ncbi:MAG: 6-carboxytetrahydropterin synthase [Bacteroidales bacterium]|nr:6-carboxytetrahydropterin synthase [Bacteroidales bacterium]
MQLLITKKFSFEMAHALDSYDGRCRNLHGHSYKLAVTATGSPASKGAKSGMVVDFGDLKRIVEQTVIEPFDHALVLCKDSPLLAGLPTKTVAVDFQPTTENLLMHFARLLEPRMPEGVRLHSLQLQETENNLAELIL